MKESKEIYGGVGGRKRNENWCGYIIISKTKKLNIHYILLILLFNTYWVIIIFNSITMYNYYIMNRT